MEDPAKRHERNEQLYDTGFLNGFLAGLSEYAWWKDGVQYVGSSGTTLAEAEDRAKKEHGGNTRRSTPASSP
jgi:hypothetical protein